MTKRGILFSVHWSLWNPHPTHVTNSPVLQQRHWGRACYTFWLLSPKIGWESPWTIRKVQETSQISVQPVYSTHNHCFHRFEVHNSVVAANAASSGVLGFCLVSHMINIYIYIYESISVYHEILDSPVCKDNTKQHFFVSLPMLTGYGMLLLGASRTGVNGSSFLSTSLLRWPFCSPASSVPGRCARSTCRALVPGAHTFPSLKWVIPLGIKGLSCCFWTHADVMQCDTSTGRLYPKKDI